MPETPQPNLPASNPEQEPEIHTIPDKFYGAALKAKVEEQKPDQPAPMAAPATASKRTIVILIIVLVVGVTGGFVYFNRSLIFPAPPSQIVVETPKPTPPQIPPSAPTDTTATSTNPQTVIVSWTDTSANESGFRVERDSGTGTFVSLTSLSPNSTSFLDNSVEHGKTYGYRILALNSSGESEPGNSVSVKVPELPPVPPEKPTLPPAGLDSDSDGITDLEEQLYGTSMVTPDTDGDGFLDGNEVFHLYNPGGQAPVRLLDSALVRIITAPIGWVMSIPTPWSITMNSENGTSATIDTKHGEMFEITIEENPNKKTIVDWYKEKHPEVSSSQILQYRSKGGYTGIIGADLLTTFIPWGDKVFVLTYDLNGQSFINYRTTYSMMLNSLLLSGLPQVSTSASTTPLPFEPSATTSGVIAQPIPLEQTTTTTATTSSL
jgi:hypothetical protein